MSPHLDTKIERPVITPIAYEDHIYVDPVVSDVVQKETVTTIDTITSKCKWKDGRQIVELDTVAIYLKSLQKMRPASALVIRLCGGDEVWIGSKSASAVS